MADVCQYCNLDTAGNHELSCPLNPNKIIGTWNAETLDNYTVELKTENGIVLIVHTGNYHVARLADGWLFTAEPSAIVEIF